MKNIAFLSCSDLDGQITDDHLLAKELESQGEFKVTTLPWDSKTNWKKFDLVIIRSTWDYVQRLEEFLKTLKSISQVTRLANSIEVVTWNYHKKYLKDLEGKGIKIVPTRLFSFPGNVAIPEPWHGEKFVIKPAISAGSYKTLIISRQDIQNKNYELHAGDWMIQPFLENIKKGEISLHYFNKNFSHAVLKVPKKNDFRVQEEFGGEIQSFSPTEELLEYGTLIHKCIPFNLLYSRVDLILHENGYSLMELELIEPSLYFRMDPNATKNFHNSLRDYI